MKMKVGICLVLSFLTLAGCSSNADSSVSVEPIVGEKGEDGKSVLTGKGAPTDSLGTDGDSYIDLDTYDFYSKKEGAWTKVGNIKGKDGEDGVDGLDGAPGKDGTNGASVLSGEGAPNEDLGSNGDFYLDTTTYDFYKKVEAAWEKVGNIKGEQGEEGEPGTTYYANTFLPGTGGYLYSDKGSYASGETVKIGSVSQSGYDLKGIEVIKDGVPFFYAEETGLSELLANGIVIKENGFVFRPVYAKKDASFEVTTDAGLLNLGAQGDGVYNLTQSTYGTAEKGVKLSGNGSFVDVVGEKGADNKPATTIYVSGKSSIAASGILSFENVNVVLAADYTDDGAIFDFEAAFVKFKNCTITIDKKVDTALSFGTGNFAIVDSSITASKQTEEANKTLSNLKTAVLFGDAENHKLANALVDNFTVNDVQGTSYGNYKGSVFKSYWDTVGFSFNIKNSTFGTEATPIAEVWSHFRRKDAFGSGVLRKDLYLKYEKTSLLEIDSTKFYSSLSTEYADDYYEPSPALITFRLMEDESDTDYYDRRVFADVLIDVNNATFNGTNIAADKVAYGKSESVPLVTIYSYDESESSWFGQNKANNYQTIAPYGRVDGTDADVVRNPNYPY